MSNARLSTIHKEGKIGVVDAGSQMNEDPLNEYSYPLYSPSS